VVEKRRAGQTEDESEPADLEPPDDDLLDDVTPPAETAKTIVEGGTRPGDSRRSTAGTVGSSTALNTELALRSDELHRTKVFLEIVIALCVVVGAGFFLLPKAGMPRWVPLVGVASIMAACGGFLLMLRDGDKFTPGRLLVVAYVSAVSATPGVYYIGIYSPALMIYVFGIYFFALGASFRMTLAIYLTVVAFSLGPPILYGAGVLADPGLLKGDLLSDGGKIVVNLLVQAVLFMTYLLARGSRRATKTAIERLHEAVVQVQKREALLVEAHQDLDRALKAGYLGRYTDQRVGAYVLGEVIGRGAMGEVYRGTHAESGQVAALKVLHPDVLAQPAHVRRFLREAEIVSTLDSPHVVRVLAIGTSDPSQVDRGELPFIAMELLEGHDLAWHLRRKRRLSERRVVELVDQVAHALTAAVKAGVVHRDLKPQNLFLSKSPGVARDERVWKVLDFGVSKLTSGAGTLTQGAVIGTPGYMAPEQARGHDVGPPADVFALAAIAYRALTGRPAFAGPDMPRILFDVCYRQPTRPSELAPLGEDVERVLAVGLAKRPEERFQHARELSEALRSATTDMGLSPMFRRRADELVEREPWGRGPLP
jgi:serine/threonine-protein kinase